MGKALLYFTPDSPPCQAVILVIKQLNLDIKFKDVDFDKNEHRTPEFFLLNPLHQVPILNDNGFLVTDSHAIISYLASGSSLTSTDARILSRINQLMYFDFELFRVMGEVAIPLLANDTIIEPNQKALTILHEKLAALEHYLRKRTWVSGEFLTIADFSVFATFSAIFHCPIDLSQYESTLAWFERCKETFVGYAAIEQDSKNAIGVFLKQKRIKLVLKQWERSLSGNH